MATRGRAKGSKYASFKDLMEAATTSGGWKDLADEGKTLTPSTCAQVLPFLERLGVSIPKEVREMASKPVKSGSTKVARAIGHTYEDKAFVLRGDTARLNISLDPYEVAPGTILYTTYEKTGITITWKKPKG